MTQEEKELLLLLLKKADSDSLLYIYDNNENTFEVTWDRIMKTKNMNKF
jgi:hypothetical protein